ncbi:hypothetical protein JYK02_24855 [Corallococcus macrosporus]|uniref:DUF7151 domain-containing protein n=1 Tax=Corallococcus macrosporus TaxID=35 RepID=A0ABS3DHF7_9BACT|nr:hypothetical protein [Corallococcus macrosporus]MBN8230749.1 hypothetical protein [Corallococcus macrosporus]
MRWTRGSWLALCLVVAGCEPIEFSAGQRPALSRIVPEPPGAACAHGGQAVQTGVDQDGDGTLEPHEVTGTDYLCDKAPGDVPVLVRTEVLPPGDACPDGGQLTRAGIDLDGDGVLEDAEVTRQVHACTVRAPVRTRLRPIGSVFSCSSNGSLLEAGEDTDGDGALDDAEVQAAHVFCMADSSQVRHAIQPEPAGGLCGRAGTRVDAYVDLDGDGQLTPGGQERRVTLTVCQPARVHDGDYRVSGPEDLAALRGVTRVDGDLQVTTDALGTVHLPELSAVMGTLRIVSNLQLTDVQLPALRFARNIELSYNSALETASIGAATGFPVLVDEEVRIQDDPLLASLDGLSMLAPRKGLSVGNVPRVETLSFPHVTALSHSFSVMEATALKSLSLPGLRSAGYVALSTNEALTSLEGLSELQAANEVSLTRLPALDSLTGLKRLQSVQVLMVEQMPGLKTVTFSQPLRVDHLELRDNPALEQVGPFPPAFRVTTSLRLSGNALLHALTPLPNLVTLDVLEVSRNPVLTDLGALGALVRVGQLDVLQNGQLQDLSALSGLRELTGLAVQDNPSLQALGLDGLTSVAGGFVVRDNPLLPSCLARQLADRAHEGPQAERLISGNDDAATCAAP